MKRLSVVIVNYNVRHFLDQCLYSLFHSELKETALEVWVVDNNSTDNSVFMIQERYPEVKLIINSYNRGFSQANNQALREIIGDGTTDTEFPTPSDDEHYVLILNPDTVVESDTLQRCLDYMSTHKDCGGLGVKMVNAEGTFLRESKRGFPSPRTSFYKIIGLARLFPHHPRYAAYYMGHVGDDTTGEVDILPGAFLMTRADVLRKVGLFDESYFMYAEDIDISWRIHESGYRNIYFPEARILHYKGECTRKESLAYVYTFYNAMAIFTRHYFGSQGFSLRSVALQAAIWLRALLAWGIRIGKKLSLPLADILLSWTGFVAIKSLWATYWASNVDYYPNSYTWVVLPLYALIMSFSVYLSGGYDKPLRPLKIMQGVALGALALLAFYSLLDESLRYSRAIVLLGALWTFGSTFALRGLLSMMQVEGFNRRSQRHRRYLIAGSEAGQRRVFDLLGSLGITPRSVITTQNRITTFPQKVDEVVFCAQDIPLHDILDDTIAWHSRRVNFRIVPATDDVLLGSNYTQCPEQLYQDNFAHITSTQSQRNKRLFDIGAALTLLIASPVMVWLQERKKQYFVDCLQVLSGRRTWVGFSAPEQASQPLPHLKKGILMTRDRLPNVKNPDSVLLDKSYARRYRVATDFTILTLNIRRL